jgi:FkbM family methyltransferase
VIAHQLRRTAQTPRAFVNWAGLLRDMTLERVGKGPDELTFVTRSGQRISCPNRPGARVPIYEVYAEDTYGLREFLGPMLNQPIRVIDIGAHVGAFACQLAAMSPRATIECFEPSASTAVYLRRNAEQNGLAERIVVDERAVAGHAGFADFVDNGAGSALNGLVDSVPAGAISGDSPTSVPTTTFDAVVADREQSVDVVKLDCEGGEYDAVLNSSTASWSSVERVVLEYHPSSRHNLDELTDWFADCGLVLLRQHAVSPNQGTAWLTRKRQTKPR